MKEFKYIICSAWPYASGIPHLGNFIGSILSADVSARYFRARGHDTIYVTGSDEHGTPIEVAALKEGIKPKQLVDKNHKELVRIFKEFGVQFENYSRTSGKNHIEFAQEFYRKVEKNGYVFSKEVELLYCKKCERFLPDRFVEGTCPRCGFESARGDQCDGCSHVLNPTELVGPACVVCRGKPEIRETVQWFFDLPKFEKKLKEYIQKQDWPENSKNLALGWLKEGLKPRTLTRDIKWGIQAPFDKSKTIYVWMEAVLGYISATKEWAEENGKDWKDYWFDEKARPVYFIGKDNIPFHAIAFAALQLANDERYVLPYGMASTEYLNFNGQQFSKSRGVGVWLDDALKLYPPDYWRYVLVSIRPETKDSSFDWKEFQKRINTELNDVLGNFVYRTLSFTKRFFDGKVPAAKLGKRDKEVLAKLDEIVKQVEEDLDNFKLQRGLRDAMQIAHLGNQYLNEREPWKLVKDDEDAAGTVLNVCTRLVKASAIALAPFLPFTAEEIWRQLNLKGSVHESWKEIGTGVSGKLGKVEPLFRKIDDKEIEKIIGGGGGEAPKPKEEVKRVGFDIFRKLDFRVATVVKAEPVKGKEKLIELGIKMGEESRTIVAGLAPHYTPEQLVGKQIVVLANLEKKDFGGGLVSDGMLLAAEKGGKVSLVTLDSEIESGSKVC